MNGVPPFKSSVSSGDGSEAAQASEGRRMDISIAIDLVLYGGLLVGFSCLARHAQPAFSWLTFCAGLAGGGLCILWGILGRRGLPCRRAAIGTLAAIMLVLVGQVLQPGEPPVAGEPRDQTARLITIVLVVFCVGMLANLIQEKEWP